MAPIPGAASATRSHSWGVSRGREMTNAGTGPQEPPNLDTAAPPSPPTPAPAPPLNPAPSGAAPPRPLVDSGAWSPGEAAPRPEPGRQYRIGDRFKPGDAIPVEGQYLCTVCGFRKHSRQFLEENPDGRFPPPHHPGALWELEDLRP